MNQLIHFVIIKKMNIIKISIKSKKNKIKKLIVKDKKIKYFIKINVGKN